MSSFASFILVTVFTLGAQVYRIDEILKLQAAEQETLRQFTLEALAQQSLQTQLAQTGATLGLLTLTSLAVFAAIFSSQNLMVIASVEKTRVIVERSASNILTLAHQQTSMLEELRNMRPMVLKTAFPEMKPTRWGGPRSCMEESIQGYLYDMLCIVQDLVIVLALTFVIYMLVKALLSYFRTHTFSFKRHTGVNTCAALFAHKPIQKRMDHRSTIYSHN